jgi:phosphoesterase RecJ-like protein
MVMIASIVEAIQHHRTFILTTHESPDGDAVGATLALAHYLRSIGKEVTVHMCDPVPELYRFLPGAELVQQVIPPVKYDVGFVLDIGELRRAGRLFQEYRDIGMIINLDHHLHCERFGAINLIDPDACATGAIVYRIIKGAGADIDYQTALCIYVAVITDTGSFRYSNANPEAFRIAGDMVAAGVNSWNVAEKLYESQPRQRLELLALALSTMTVSARGDYASITVTLDMYERSGSDSELTDGFVNYPRSISGVEVAIFFRELSQGHFKVGFRSKGKVDVSALAAAFGGGGHHNAAGCTVSAPLEEVKRQVFAHLESVL